MKKMYNTNKTKGKAKNRKIVIGRLSKEEVIKMMLKSGGYQPPACKSGAHKSIKDYDRKRMKKEMRQMMRDL